MLYGQLHYTSNYELERPLPKGKYEKVIGLMKDELIRSSFTFQKEFCRKNIKNNNDNW